MSQVTAQMVKDLREMTGAGPLDCKKALEANNGDIQQAIGYLRDKGLAKAAKKLSSGRAMNEGVIETYNHFNRRLGVMVEVNCETDFVANTPRFRAFAKDIALHIANMNPDYVRREHVPEAVLQAERDLHRRRALETGKPENIVERIIEGNMTKFYSEVVLMEQPFLKDDSKTIQQILAEAVAELGENIQVGRFARFALGDDNSSDAEAAADAE